MYYEARPESTAKMAQQAFEGGKILPTGQGEGNLLI